MHPEDVSFLASLLPHCHCLRHLTTGETPHLKLADLQVLEKALRECPTLETCNEINTNYLRELGQDIDLSDRPAAALGTLVLAESLKKREVLLDRLNMHGCLIGSEGVLVFSSLMNYIANLTTVILSNNRHEQRYCRQFPSN